MSEWGIGKDAAVGSKDRCPACLNRGYLHVIGRRHGEPSQEVPCPECVCGKRYIKAQPKRGSDEG